jgi:hypothetical protein
MVTILFAQHEMGPLQVLLQYQSLDQSFYLFQLSILINFRLCRDAEQFTDLVFKCCDGQVAAHKLVVAAASPFLRDVLLELQPDDEVAVLVVPDVALSALCALLDFIYTVCKGQRPILNFAHRGIL